MRLRVLIAMVVACAVSLALFALPLAELVQEYYRDQTRVALDDRMTTALPTLTRDAARAVDYNEDPDYQIGIYGADGARIAGRGPDQDSAIVPSASAGHTSSVLDDDGSIVVAMPTGGGPVVRGQAAASVVDASVRTAWAAIVGLAAGVLAVVGLGAWFGSRRLVRPVDQLTADLRRLGEGDFDIAATSTGVSEIDTAHEALATTASRLEDTLERERAFSADVAHQLRTPIASLRLGLEGELLTPRADPGIALREAVAEVDRLQATTEDLLSLARHADATATPIDTSAWLRDGVERWNARYHDANRTIDIDGEVISELPAVLCHRGRLDQVLDILLENALEHGRGTVTVVADARDSHVYVTVGDEGPGLAESPPTSNVALGGDGKRIGLDLARRLVESDGGRLGIAVNAQPTITLIFPTAPTGDEDNQ